MHIESTYFNKPLRQDNVFIPCEVKSLAEITNGKPIRKGLERVILADGEVVNVVSKSYGHLSNETLFYEVENRLNDAGIHYDRRAINRANRSFAVDYILNDESYHINVKNGTDTIRPMLRFTNSYDGSCPASGHFGFFREVCSNGLHVAQSQVGFCVKHKGNVAQLVLPEIGLLVQRFMNNEFYSLHRRFEVMAETPLTDVKDFVRINSERLKLFVYQTSEKNPEPSKNARLVIDSIYRESNLLGTDPNLWIGYNALNNLLHDTLKRPFNAQRRTDARMFQTLQTALS